MNTDLLLTLLLASIFFLVFIGLYKMRLEKKVQASENIQHLLGAPQAQANKQPVKKKDAVLKRRSKNTKPKAQKLALQLERANWLIKPEEFYLLSIVAAGAGGLLGFLGHQPFFLIGVCALAGFFLPKIILKLKGWMRMRKAEEQFADVLDALVNCFKTGYGFNRAIQVIADNFEDPWGTEFGKMSVEITLGSQPDEVLLHLTQRVPSPDVDLFVTGLLIQKETGGNLAELLSNLSRICRERFKLFRKVGAISAQGKLSALIIIGVPPFLFFLMYMFQPDATKDFVTSLIGIILLSIAGIWMCFGIFVLWKIVQIEV